MWGQVVGRSGVGRVGWVVGKWLGGWVGGHPSVPGEGGHGGTDRHPSKT